jgi:hypothetical protein
MTALLLAWVGWRVLRALLPLTLILAIGLLLLARGGALVAQHPQVGRSVQHGLRQIERRLEHKLRESSKR